ncbi:alpha/beta fold hydrolase [Aureibacter tunicatorum]|uniref:Pimeloyl-ACP methyl ester carboxylesterase n=1 Tax=Aureibacter tunicatorum TaxID=866807 RepID=A0AAE3XML1_9BACT|nr:alpha/beta hydrolase [Aureibacter tunicatorum]MDR6239358.1 pimeloyl-ACP methyl ester carboxylesterase [Aureibacter tunicatorum]BDD04719.1 alpha/beta hydrolase [Aureibacter tunicatorum]
MYLFNYHKEGSKLQVYSNHKSSGKPILFFIHGSPGSWQAFKGYLQDEELSRDYWMFSVNRLGYGGSETKHSLHIQLQSSIIMSFIRSIIEGGNDRLFLLVGHSYGGGVSMDVFQKSQDIINGLLLIAPTLAPELQRVKFYNKFAKLRVVNKLLPSNLKMSNKEMYNIYDDLLEVERSYPKVNNPVWLIHGTRDKIVSFGTVEYLRHQLSHDILKIIVIEKGDHFIPWKKKSFVKQVLLDFFELLAKL